MGLKPDQIITNTKRRRKAKMVLAVLATITLLYYGWSILILHSIPGINNSGCDIPIAGSLMLVTSYEMNNADLKGIVKGTPGLRETRPIFHDTDDFFHIEVFPGFENASIDYLKKRQNVKDVEQDRGACIKLNEL